jgi:thiamine biosynthesis protein ThiS
MSVLKINGQETTFTEGKMPATITDLLLSLGVDSAAVVAEVDGQIIEKANFQKTALRDGQSIELVRFVPGG